MDISGASALVTGGASGLGLATARRLAAAGAAVTIVDLPSSAGASVAEELGGSFAAADVTDPEQVAAAVAQASAAGPLRVVVNCAGIAPPAKVLDRDGNPSPLADFERIVRINLDRHVQRDRPGIRRHGQDRADRRRRPRRHRQHGERRGVRRADRAARLLGEQGRRARHDPADRARARALRHPGAARSPPASWRPRCSRACRRPRRTRSASRCPYPQRLGRPDEYARLVLAIIDNGYLNGETIRLDGAIRMAPK